MEINKRIKKRWKEYMETLMNVENEWDGQVEGVVVEGPGEHIRGK